MAAYYNLVPGAFFQRTSAVSTRRVTRGALHCGAIATQVWRAIQLAVALLWAVAALGFLLLILAGFLAG